MINANSNPQTHLGAGTDLIGQEQQLDQSTSAYSALGRKRGQKTLGDQADSNFFDPDGLGKSGTVVQRLSDGQSLESSPNVRYEGLTSDHQSSQMV